MPDDNEKPSLLKCDPCGKFTEHEMHLGWTFSDQEFYKCFECYNCGDCERQTFYCVACQSNMLWKSIRKHINTKCHADNRVAWDERQLRHPPVAAVLLPAAPTAADEQLNDCFDCCMGDDDDDEADDDHGADSSVPVEVASSYDDGASAGSADVSAGSDGANGNNKQDWLLKLGKTMELGREPLSLDDLVQNAGFHGSSSSPGYYWEEHKKPGQGMKHLVARAYSIADVEDITDGEAAFTLTLCTLLLKLTEEERELLGSCMQYAYNANVPDKNVFVKTRCPLTSHDFDDYYVKKSTAVIPNLPHPVTEETQDGTHAYTHLTDVIANMLAASTPVENFQHEARAHSGIHPPPADCDQHALPTVSSTPAALDLYNQLASDGENERQGDDFVLYLWYKEWRDDFDPFNTKKSRNQVWAYTHTICPPSTERSGRNTYYMALSRKGDDHSEVERILAQELKTLSTKGMTAYHGGLRKIIKVKVGKLLNCVDRPEKTSLFRLGEHGGDWSAAFGYAAKVDGFCKDNHLPSCEDCRKARLNHLLLLQNSPEGGENGGHNAQCARCSDWDLMKMTSFALKKHWPTTYDKSATAPNPPAGREIKDEPNADGKIPLSTVQYSINWCKQVVDFAHHNAKTKHRPNGGRKRPFWVKAQLKEYMRTCGFSESKLITAVYESAKNEDPKFAYPPTWFPDDALIRTHYAPMHTLMLGHVKLWCRLLTNWMKKYEILATFGKQANMLLKEIQALRCRKYADAQPFSTSTWGTGIWVSENYSSWARMQKFFVVLLPAIHDKVRRVRQNSAIKREFKIVMRFVMSSHAALARIMSPKRHVHDMDAAIKLYLDSLFEMDRISTDEDRLGQDDEVNPLVIGDDGRREATTSNAATRDEEEESQPQEANPRQNKRQRQPESVAGTIDDVTDAPAGNKKGVFGNRAKTTFNNSISLGILGAAEAHNYFGPAIINWEGGWAGEKKIKDAKPLMGVQRNNAAWQSISLTRYLRLHQIGQLRGNVRSSKSRELEGALKVYKSEKEFREAFEKHLPLSAIVDSEDNIWAACRPLGDKDSRCTISLLKLAFQDEQGELVNDMCWCAPISYDQNNEKPKYYSRRALDESFVSEYVLLIPRLDEKGQIYRNSYYAVGSNWTERVRSGKFSVPEIKYNVFSDWCSVNDDEASTLVPINVMNVDGEGVDSVDV